MLNPFAKKTLVSGLIVGFFVTLGFLLPQTVSAQSGGGDCSPPDFQITSSKNISAITGESFTYYVVTQNDTSFQLDSSLPSGLSFANGQISGTPQTSGDYNLRFSAQNNCGEAAETISLSVLDGARLSQSSAAGQSDTGSGGEGSVQLDEIPETGLSADQAITVSFYVLALLLISALAATKLTPAFATSGGSQDGQEKNVGDYTDTNRRSQPQPRSVDAVAKRQSYHNRDS